MTANPRRVPHRRPDRVPCVLCGAVVAAPSLAAHQRSQLCAYRVEHDRIERERAQSSAPKDSTK